MPTDPTAPKGVPPVPTEPQVPASVAPVRTTVMSASTAVPAGRRGSTQVGGRPARRRAVLSAVAVAVVVAGLLVATAGRAPWADPAGDALYAALVYLGVLVVAPCARPAMAAVVAGGVCALVELAQATGVPAAVVDVVPAARFLLGTTFVATDLLVYAAAVVGCALVDAVLRRRRRPSR